MKTVLAAFSLCKSADIDGKTYILATDKQSRIFEQMQKGLKPVEELTKQETAIINAGEQLRSKIAGLWISSAEKLIAIDAVMHAVMKMSNKLGIHARPAGMFCKVACKFNSHIFTSKDDYVVDGKDIMDLMMLAAGPGSEVIVYAVGNDAKQALIELEALVLGKFYED